NHILNTLLLRASGEHAWWGVYRLPALAAGLATVALAWRVARRWGELEGGLAAALAASSFLLILYSSEARGHPLMLAFALGAFVALEERLETGSRPAYAAWASCVWLGFLSHLMFVQAYAGLALWSAWRLRRFLPWLRLNAPALAAGAFLYVVQVRKMGHAGGAPQETLRVLRETLALAVGAPELAWAWAAGALGLAAAAWAIYDLARQGRDEWTFFAVVVFLAPGLLVLLHPPGLLFPRYFLLALAFGAALWARAGAAAWRFGPFGRAALGLALALYLAGNAARVRGFLADGRGHYRDALAHLADETPGAEVTVGSGHDFAHKMMVDFYSPYVPQKTFRYVTRDRWSKTEPEWVIGHGERHQSDPPAELTATTGVNYRLDRVYRYFDQSGWDWLLYRRATSTSAP
ncbi:MAG: hypothetical protein HY925_03080, partial [Elusimicrobia bacterium]|nr:hypothetical protein [Elusimicrobiota bacterium]